MSESAVERVMMRILNARFESVGVDRRRRRLGQILSRGLHNALQGGVLKFDIMENALRKFALFRNDPDMVLRFLEELEEHPELKIVNTVDARAIPVTGEEVPGPEGADAEAAADAMSAEAVAEAEAVVEETLAAEVKAEAVAETIVAAAAEAEAPAAEMPAASSGEGAASGAQIEFDHVSFG